MNDFDFVEDVLKKAKSSYDISEDKQLQQANIAVLNSGDLVQIKHQYNESIEKYKKQILPLGKDKTISLEMLSTFGWGKYADHNYGVDDFGSSAKAADIINARHFDVESFVNYVKGVK